jgi:uncharacterized DUF497 family protein
MAFTFEWDAAKARSNLTKHGVSFDEALTVFLARLAGSSRIPIIHGMRLVSYH